MLNPVYCKVGSLIKETVVRPGKPSTYAWLIVAVTSKRTCKVLKHDCLDHHGYESYKNVTDWDKAVVMTYSSLTIVRQMQSNLLGFELITVLDQAEMFNHRSGMLRKFLDPGYAPPKVSA